MKTKLLTIVGMMALAAVFAAPAANAQTVTLANAEEEPVGYVEMESDSWIQFKSSTGSWECSGGVFRGEVVENQSDPARASLSEGNIGGTYTGSSYEEPCKITQSNSLVAYSNTSADLALAADGTGDFAISYTQHLMSPWNIKCNYSGTLSATWSSPNEIDVFGVTAGGPGCSQQTVTASFVLANGVVIAVS